MFLLAESKQAELPSHGHASHRHWAGKTTLSPDAPVLYPEKLAGPGFAPQQILPGAYHSNVACTVYNHVPPYPIQEPGAYYQSQPVNFTMVQPNAIPHQFPMRGHYPANSMVPRLTNNPGIILNIETYGCLILTF